MKIRFICVGKTVNSSFQAIINDYEKRISRYVQFEIVYLKNISKGKKLNENEVKELESKMIIDNMSITDSNVLLDERGKEYSSTGFAGFIQNYQMTGIKNLTFISGGAYGFSNEIYGLVKNQVSLSKMTFSHQMIRVIFAEQLYRALTIINNEPYHH